MYARFEMWSHWEEKSVEEVLVSREKRVFLEKKIHRQFLYYVGEIQLHNVLNKNDTLFFTDI